MGISGLWGTGDNIANMPGGAGFAYVLGSLVLYLVTAFVFAAGGILLIIRFVVLNIYMVLSPLMFLGWVFPGFSNVSREYWSGFMSRAFFAPAYILMIYFAHQILVNLKGAGGASGMANALLEKDAALAKAGFVSTIPYFIITSVFLIAAIVVAQKMGAVGATNAIAIGKRMSGKARKYATNTATYIPRAGARMAVNKGGEKFTKTLNNIQTGKGWGAAIAKTNIVDRAARGTLTAATGAKFGTGTTNKDERDYKAKTQSRANQTEAENTRTKAFEDANEVLADTTKSSTELGDALDALAKTMREMSKEEKEKLTVTQLTDKNIAAHLSDSDIENLEKSGKLGNFEIQKIKDAKKAAFEAIAVGGSTLATVVPPPAGSPAGTPSTATYANPSATVIDRRSEITNYSTKDIAKMPASIFTDARMIKYIKTPMLEERLKNVKTTKAERAQIKANIDAYLLTPTTPPADVARWNKWIADSNHSELLGY